MKLLIETNLDYDLRKEFEANGDTGLPEDLEDFDEMRKTLLDGKEFGSLSGVYSAEFIRINAQKHVVDEWKMNHLVDYLLNWFPRIKVEVTPLGGKGCDFCITITQEAAK